MNWKNCLARQRKEDKYDDKFGFVGMMEMEQKLMCYLAEQIRGVSYKPDDLHKQLDENSVILLRANNIDDGQINFDDVVYVDRSKVSCSQFLRKGDILVCASSGSRNLVGKAAQIDFEGKYTFGAFCKVVRPKEIDAEYLGMYFLSPTYRSIIASLAQGANINNIKNEHIDSLIVNIGNENECQQIVNILSRLLRVIHLRQQEIKELDDLIKARFVEMFGDPIKNPKGWEVVTIGDIVTEVKYGTSKPAVEGGKYPYLRMNNLTSDGHLDLNDLKYIDISEDEIEKCVVRKGDVLFNRTNSIELVGKTAVFDLLDDMVIAGYIIRVRLNERMLPEVLSQYMNLEALKDILRSMAKGAVNQANINAQELQSIKVYIPDMGLQKKFIEMKEQVDKSKVAIQKIHKKGYNCL